MWDSSLKEDYGARWNGLRSAAAANSPAAQGLPTRGVFHYHAAGVPRGGLAGVPAPHPCPFLHLQASEPPPGSSWADHTQALQSFCPETTLDTHFSLAEVNHEAKASSSVLWLGVSESWQGLSK